MKRKGFTLLELLIVIIIIGLLAAIGIVQYGKAVGSAKNAAAKAALGEMRKAAMAYYAVYGAYPTGGSITVELADGATVEFNSPTSASHTFSAITGNKGVAAKVTGEPSNVYNWSIEFANGTIGSY